MASSVVPLPTTAVFGANGFIGRHLRAALFRDNQGCIAVARQPLAGQFPFELISPDIASLQLRQRGVSSAIIAAGVTSIAYCEQYPEQSRAVNITGTVALARQLRHEGLRVVAFSSDYVFDGSQGNYCEAARVNPLNEYGRQKAAMERELLAACDGEALIIRLSKVFDTIRGSGTLLDEMAANMLQGVPLRAAADQYFCPTSVEDVIAGVRGLLLTDLTGIVHLCSPDRISRFQLAVTLANAFGAAPSLIERISLKDLGEKFRRPLDTSMVCSRLPHVHFTPLAVCIERLKAGYAGQQGRSRVFIDD